MKDEKIWSVYVHTNKINGKKYVGITSREPLKRWDYGCGYRPQKYFYSAIQKYGWDNFKHEILLTNETKEYACKAERCLIKAYKSNNSQYGYNLSSGGESGSFGIPWPEERKIALSNKLKNRVISDEWRKKISESKKGTNLSKETKRKLSIAKSGENNPFYGKHHTEETKKLISEKTKARDKSTINTTGLKHGKDHWTEETYKKLSEANRGEKSASSKLTEENVIDILKMIQAGLAYCEIKKHYNISDSEISRIRHRKRWSYLYEKYPELYK